MVPYFILLLLVAVPLLFMELSVSQYSNLGPGNVWILCPLFKGLGLCVVILIIIIGVYYNIILSWVLYYLYSSMHPTLAWSSCNNTWNTPQCYETMKELDTLSLVGNNSGIDILSLDGNNSGIGTLLNITENVTTLSRSSTEEFWERHVLELSSSVDEIGGVRLPLLLCLFIMWLITFLCLIKGIKTSGKIVYVAATLPYVLLLTLLIRGLTLPGSTEGVLYFTKPRWEKLKELSVWKNAAVQVLYSIGLGTGGVATLSSYNDFHNNCQRDAIILPLIDGLTSWFCGLTTFSILGYMAHISGTDIDSVVSQGPGIAFIVYPQALSTLPMTQLWAVLFFTMLVLVGLDSQFVHVQIIVTALTDAFPNELRRYQTKLTAFVCFVGFLLGISCITKGGMYILQMLDWYCTSLSVLFITLMETIAIMWIYGVNRLYADITHMLGYRPWTFWKPFWTVINPVCIMGLLILSLGTFTHLKYGNGRDFPQWATNIGWLIALICIVPCPIMAVIEILRKEGHLMKRLKTSITPTKEWGPATSTPPDPSEEFFLSEFETKG